MATVPRVSALSVAPAAAPNVAFGNTNSSQRYEGNAGVVAQLGANIGQAGNVLEAVRYQELERANLLRVDDALNEAQEQALRLRLNPKDGYSTLTGRAAVEREGGLPLAEEYTAKLDTQVSQIERTLGNERQREVFRARAATLRTQFLGNAMAYEGQQQQEYKRSVREATTTQAVNSIALMPLNPENVQLHTFRLRASIEGGVDPDSGVFVEGSAQMQGKSAAWAKERADEAVSSAYAMSIGSLLEKGDLVGAAAFRKTYGASLQAKDLLRIDGTLERATQTARGAAIGNQVFESMKRDVEPDDVDRAFNIAVTTESGNRQLDGKGAPLTSSAGAIGIAQVMPDTAKAAAKRMGIPWDEERYRTDAAYNKALGRNEFEFQVKAFNGDVAKAYAAYNAGPRWVKEAEGRAASAAAGSEQASWLWQLNNDGRAPQNREETRNYVDKNMRSYVAGGGLPARPTLEQFQEAARAAVGSNAHPVALKQALETAEQRFTAATAAVAQRKDEAVARGYQALEKANGRWSDVPALVRADIESRAPDKLDDLRGFGARVAKGDEVTDDRLYLRLMTNPKETLGKMTDAQFYAMRGGLNQSDFQMFAKMRGDLRSGIGGSQPGDLNDQAITRTLDSRLQTLGVKMKPRDGSEDAARLGVIRRVVDASIIDAQQQAGKKFNDAEVQKHIDELFAKNVKFRNTVFGHETTSGSQQLLSMKPSDVPSDARDRIKAAFKAQGNDEPSSADILGAYMASQVRKPSAAVSRTGAF